MNKDEFDRIATLILIGLAVYTLYLMTKKKGGCGCKGEKKSPLPAPSCGKGSSGVVEEVTTMGKKTMLTEVP